MEDAACVVQLANKINEQSSTKVDLDEVNCVFLMHALLSIVTVHIHGKYVINAVKLHRQLGPHLWLSCAPFVFAASA